jgi:PTS system mannitol-specific IIC component
MGVVVGTSIPMFLGAMIMGPLAGYIIKKFDEAIHGKVKAGFEMLVNNFSAGITGGILAVIAYFGIGPVVEALSNGLGSGVGTIVDAGLFPLASVFVEPAKILFLNNAINHGVLSPLGIAQAAETGKSIFFMVETNPGPGLGILLAFWLFGKGMAKNSAPGAIIIHFLGGIHEIYFPYVLMKPILLLAAIGGGASGLLTFSIFNAGLVAPPSPGSIFAELAMTPRGGFLGTLAGIAVSAAVAFIIAAFFLKRDKSMSDESLEAAKAQTIANKGKESSVIKTGTKKSSDIMLTFDGQAGLVINEKDAIQIEKGPHPVQMLTLPGSNYFDLLKTKLRWSGGRA